MEHPPTWPKCPACVKNNPIPSKSYAFLGGSLAILTPLTMKTLHSQNGQEHASVWKLSIPILYGYGPWFIYGGLPMDFRGFYVGSPMDLEVPSIIFSPKYGTIVGFSKALSFFVKLHVLPSFRPRFSQVFWSAARLRTAGTAGDAWCPGGASLGQGADGPMDGGGLGVPMAGRSGWWFGTWIYCSIDWEESSQLTFIFSRGVETTNQTHIYIYSIYIYIYIYMCVYI